MSHMCTEMIKKFTYVLMLMSCRSGLSGEIGFMINPGHVAWWRRKRSCRVL